MTILILRIRVGLGVYWNKNTDVSGGGHYPCSPQIQEKMEGIGRDC